jgi:hypothetical protein
VGRWLEANGYERGVTLDVPQVAELARAWWQDRLDRDWRPHTREENQAILERVGLTGPFWQLA